MRLATVLAVAIAVVPAAAPAPAQDVTPEPRTFKPVKIAVVDISEVFAQYNKKKDVEAELKKEIEKAEKDFQANQKELKRLQEDLKNVQEGTKQHRDLMLQAQAKEYEIKTTEKEVLKKFRDKQIEKLKEIRDQITTDIQKYAEGVGIDLVLEKQVVAGPEGDPSSFKWPIVHYVKGELNITTDIIKRLNAQYGKPAASEGAPKGAGKDTGEKRPAAEKSASEG